MILTGPIFGTMIIRTNTNHLCITGATAMATATKALTADQVKEHFRRAGITFTAWAEEHGNNRNEVYRVLNGQAKANYGKAHEIAVKLGLKPAADAAAAA